MNIHCASPVKLIANNDTIPGDTTDYLIYVKRQKKPLMITIFNDSLSKDLVIKSKISATYYLNAYPVPLFGGGLFIDLATQRRFTYPNHIYTDINDKRCSFTLDKHYLYPKNPFVPTYVNQLKIAPFRFTTAIRGLFVSYERLYLGNNSTQITSALIFDPVANTPFSTWQYMRGFSVAVEQKRFLDNALKGRGYISLDAGYTNSNHTLYTGMHMRNAKDSLERSHDHYDTVTVQRKTLAFCLRYGLQYYYKHFVIDVNIGGGVNYRNVRHINKLHEYDEMNYSRHPNLSDAINGEGNVPVFIMVVGFKIGYMF